MRAGYGGERDAPTLAMCLASKMRAWFLVRFIGFLSFVHDIVVHGFVVQGLTLRPCVRDMARACEELVSESFLWCPQGQGAGCRV